MKRAATVIKERRAKGERDTEIASYLRGYYVPSGSKPTPKQVRQYRAGIEQLQKDSDNANR